MDNTRTFSNAFLKIANLVGIFLLSISDLFSLYVGNFYSFSI